ncbi:hypothetical protein M885DRAFT_552761 [Pelagophyceae sp. CCMP2097]|nr:hypothetical protein M885DRAFT_552761 [Pelagophyceae sp. CCMP2097]
MSAKEKSWHSVQQRTVASRSAPNPADVRSSSVIVLGPQPPSSSDESALRATRRITPGPRPRRSRTFWPRTKRGRPNCSRAYLRGRKPRGPRGAVRAERHSPRVLLGAAPLRLILLLAVAVVGEIVVVAEPARHFFLEDRVSAEDVLVLSQERPALRVEAGAARGAARRQGAVDANPRGEHRRVVGGAAHGRGRNHAEAAAVLAAEVLAPRLGGWHARRGAIARRRAQSAAQVVGLVLLGPELARGRKRIERGGIRSGIRRGRAERMRFFDGADAREARRDARRVARREAPRLVVAQRRRRRRPRGDRLLLGPHHCVGEAADAGSRGYLSREGGEFGLFFFFAACARAGCIARAGLLDARDIAQVGVRAA